MRSWNSSTSFLLVLKSTVYNESSFKSTAGYNGACTVFQMDLHVLNQCALRILIPNVFFMRSCQVFMGSSKLVNLVWLDNTNTGFTEVDGHGGKGGHGRLGGKLPIHFPRD